MKTTPKLSDLDLYINNIVEQLRAKYGYADKNPLNSSVRFYVRPINGKFVKFPVIDKVIELTYTELTESMNKKELPREIQKLL